VTTQRVCGAACRRARDGKLARARRGRELDAYRDDERRRQRDARAARSKAQPGVAPAGCHAPPSAAKSTELPEEIAQLVDRAVDRSRASLLRDLRRIWPQQREIVAPPGAPSRASFGVQPPEMTSQSDAILDHRHA
jgi:hypothetical protein